MHFLALEPARIARTVDVLVMLSCNRRKDACLRQIFHLQDAACAVCRMLLHDIELALRQAAVLREDVRVHVDFSKIVQETAERDEGQLLLRQVTEHSHHRRENSDIDTVCECIGIVCTDVRELYEVRVVVEEIKDDGIRHLLQGGNVQCSVFFDGLKRVVDSTDCVDARLFLDDIWRR